LSPDLERSLAAVRLDVVAKQDSVDRTRATLANAERETDEVVVDPELLTRAEQIELLTVRQARRERQEMIFQPCKVSTNTG